MALNIKNPEAGQLAQELAQLTGESLTDVVTNALRDRLLLVRRQQERSALMSDILQIQAFVAALPDLDNRAPDEILGYDDFGLPS
ncbi:type II toxin-antitoxin system VapB family antitoxin [Longimicrobium sp.]|uniref:type II toxin-antitoxin system VapB family antitoxin n=1 Tax=Longimicrobium sp. TaxID=2029185 RepID=UPI002E3668C4|nr:type II toxin-antitoxin system VapB family antitoxin [Longimicrobium sp.]HEX6041759.1 type II toxin-antitoxin system VapB family antitoxin [Longimicrobium sp.]